ncbi:MAG: hypothetical protein AAF596_10525 [Planctomycetota bacterium]
MNDSENPYTSPLSGTLSSRENRVYAVVAAVIWLVGSLFVGVVQILVWPIYAGFEITLPFLIQKTFLFLPCSGVVIGGLLQVLISVFSSAEWTPLLQSASILLAVVFFMAGVLVLVYPLVALLVGLM